MAVSNARSENDGGRSVLVVVVGWLLLIGFLIASAIMLRELVVLPRIVPGCFDIGDPACSAPPTPMWAALARCGLWTLTGGLVLGTVRVAYELPAGRSDLRRFGLWLGAALLAGVTFAATIFVFP